jgi:hypothetical protein
MIPRSRQAPMLVLAVLASVLFAVPTSAAGPKKDVDPSLYSLRPQAHPTFAS